MAFHSNETTGSIHIPYNFSYADESARTGATGFASGDVGKFARQLDNDSVWMLTAYSPAEWMLIGGGGEIVAVDSIQFNLTATPSHSEGQLHWNNTDKTLEIDTEFSGVATQVGQENVGKIRNASGSQIDNGKVVYVSGVDSARPKADLAIASNPPNAGKVIGLYTHDCPTATTGIVTTFGIVRDFDTSSFSPGDWLWLSSSTAGDMQNTRPAAPNFGIRLGIVLTSDASTGSIWLKPRMFENLSELSDVDAHAGADDLSMLYWDDSPGVWSQLPAEWMIYNQDPTGFDRGADGTGAVSTGDISFENSTRTFTIQPQGGESDFSFWVQGVKYTKTSAQNVVITDVEGEHFIYFDDTGTLQESTTIPSQWLTEYAPVAIVRWNATDDEEVYLGEERHGYRMSGQTHRHFHKSIGTQFYSGIEIGDLQTDESGSLDTHAQFSHTAGQIGDEDIQVNIPGDAVPANAPVYYKLGASGDWRLKTADNFPFIYSGTAGYTGASGRVAYNEWTGSTWQLTEVGNGNLIVMLYFATNDASRPVIGIQGENEYGNISDAREGIVSELTNLVKIGLPFVEFVACWGLIIQTSTGYTNTPKARFRTLDDGSDYLDLRDFRGLATGSGTGITSHSLLTNLLNQDHPQYRYYDAVVEEGVGASSGRYPLVSDALTAGHKRIFVKAGSYVETGDITLTDGCHIIGDNGAVISFSGAYGIVADGSGGVQETAGTISVTNGDATVLGSGTAFTNLSPGDFIKIGSSFFSIDSITSDISLELSAPYGGATESGLSYIAQTMIDVALDGLRIYASSGTGIHFRACVSSGMNGVEVVGCNVGVHIEDCGGIVFERNGIFNSTTNGLVIDGSHSISLNGFHVVNSGGIGILVSNSSVVEVVQGGASASGGDGIYINALSVRVSLTSVVSTHNDGKGINIVTGSDEITINGAVIDKNAGDGIEIDGDDSVLDSCVIVDNGGNGIVSGRYCLISNNHIGRNTLNGIILNGDDESIVSSNHISSNFGDGVRVESGSNIIVSGNVITDNDDGLYVALGGIGTKVVGNQIFGNTADINNNDSSTVYGVSTAGEPAQGDVLHHNGTVWTRLAPGTSGQVLTTGGAAADPSWEDANIVVAAEGTPVGTRPELNFIEGTGISLTVADDAGNDRVNITITADNNGDVVGPASATDNAIVRFDTTTGKLVQNSVVTIDDSGNFSGAGTFNGVTVEAHADRHENGGADEIDVTALSGQLADPQTVVFSDTGTPVGTRPELNFIEGTGITLTIADDGPNDRVNVTITADNNGDVVGPASSTDNAVARFDGTTGKLIQDSVVIIGDTGVITGVSTINGVVVEDHSARHENGGADEISVVGLSGQLADAQTVVISDAATPVGTRPEINFIEGAGITFTIADDAGNDRVNITVAADNNGDVVGPSSSTDNAIVIFDGATGKLVQNSGIVIQDGGTIELNNNSIIEAKTITFNSAPTVTPSAGTAACEFDNYQKIIVNLNNVSTVTIQLDVPLGPGNFMLEIIQGSTTPTTTLNWSTEGTHALYAPGGSMDVQSGAGEITIVGLFYDGSSWFATLSPMAQVLAS